MSLESREIVLEKVRVGCSRFLSKQAVEELDLDVIYEHLIVGTIYAFNTWVFAEEIDNRTKKIVFQYPASAWQMFKHQYFPKWLLRHFPVKYAEASKTVRFKKQACYPQLPLHMGKPVGQIKYVSNLFEEGEFPFEQQDYE